MHNKKECYHTNLRLIRINKDSDDDDGGSTFWCADCMTQVMNDIWICDVDGYLPFKEMAKRVSKFYTEQSRERDKRSRNKWQ